MVEQRLNLLVLAGCGNLAHDGAFVEDSSRIASRSCLASATCCRPHEATSSSVRCLTQCG
jgi:hypothetical protein